MIGGDDYVSESRKDINNKISSLMGNDFLNENNLNDIIELIKSKMTDTDNLLMHCRMISTNQGRLQFVSSAALTLEINPNRVYSSGRVKESEMLMTTKQKTVKQPQPFTPGFTQEMVRRHAYTLYSDKAAHDSLTLADWVLAEKDLLTTLETEGVAER